MAKIKKKGVSGNAKNFITRTQAVRKLQVSLPDFRRLCIFKGIYPREPRNKKKANKGSTQSTTFYYTKDIQYLLHEPVLQKFRDHKAFAKKLQKALGRGDFSDAKRLETTQKPVIRLDHIVKERYPTFTDALRDLDDALSMIHLFASLPTNENLPPATVANCARLVKEWAHYVIRAGALRKSFLSIKGIYYQAEVGGGQEVLWLVPYSFAQNVPVDVDFRIMHTFVEFYTTLVGFVLFRLYAIEGLVYPPRFDKDADENAGGLGAFTIESRGAAGLFTTGDQEKKRAEEAGEQKDVSKQMATLGAKIASLTNEDSAASTTAEPEQEEGGTSREDLTIDTFTPAASSSDPLPQPTSSQTTSTSTTLFLNTTFYLSRETPREPLEFLLRSLGCKRIGWDAVLGAGAYTEDPSDISITHQVVDRPPTFPPPSAAGNGSAPSVTPSTATATTGRVPGRIYVQPQYVWDCINAGRLLPPGEYAPGALLPPHLSPWVKPGEGYDPTAALPDVEHSEGEEEEAVEDSDNGMQEDLASESEPEPAPAPPTATAPIEDEPSEEEEEEEEESEYQRELAAEAAGTKPPTPSEQAMKKQKKKNKAKMTRQQREEEDQKEMKKVMMSRRKRKLYEKMVYSNAKKEGEVEGLKRKRRKLEGRSKGKKGGRGGEEV